MSAKALTACSFEAAAEEAVATGHPAPASSAAETQFRKDLWREYRREAINAGLSPAQAAEYASALSPALGLVAGASEMAPVGRGWFYQSRSRVVKRTITSGLITLMRWDQIKTTGRTAASRTPILARLFRPWKTGVKS